MTRKRIGEEDYSDEDNEDFQEDDNCDTWTSCDRCESVEFLVLSLVIILLRKMSLDRGACCVIFAIWTFLFSTVP